MLQGGPLGHLRISHSVCLSYERSALSLPGNPEAMASQVLCLFFSIHTFSITLSELLCPSTFFPNSQGTQEIPPKTLDSQTTRGVRSSDFHTQNGKGTLLKFGRRIWLSWGYLVNHLLLFSFSSSPSWIKMLLLAAKSLLLVKKG